MDVCGFELTTDRREVGDAFARIVGGILAHRADVVERIDAALALDEDLAAAWLVRGLGARFLARNDLAAAVRDAHARATRAIERRGGSAQERALCGALGDWIDGSPDRAAARLDRSLSQHPTDALVLKLCHAIHFLLGDSPAMRKSVERALPAWSEDVAGFPYVLGCHAFALEETGALAEAERQGRRAAEIEPNDVWAIHAVGHVLWSRGRHRDGLRWLDQFDRDWGRATLGRHVLWHRALFHCALHEVDEALSIYDEGVAQFTPGDYRDVSNSASLLFLVERDGVDVADRWRRLARRIDPFTRDHGSAFADVHYALAVASADVDRAAANLDSLRRYATDATGFEAAVQREVGLPVAEAVVALRGGDRPRAARLLHACRDRLVRLGGSAAQRSIFTHLSRAAQSPAVAGEKRDELAAEHGVR